MIARPRAIDPRDDAAHEHERDDRRHRDAAQHERRPVRVDRRGAGEEHEQRAEEQGREHAEADAATAARMIAAVRPRHEHHAGQRRHEARQLQARRPLAARQAVDDRDARAGREHRRHDRDRAVRQREVEGHDADRAHHARDGGGEHRLGARPAHAAHRRRPPRSRRVRLPATPARPRAPACCASGGRRDSRRTPTSARRRARAARRASAHAHRPCVSAAPPPATRSHRGTRRSRPPRRTRRRAARAARSRREVLAERAPGEAQPLQHDDAHAEHAAVPDLVEHELAVAPRQRRVAASSASTSASVVLTPSRPAGASTRATPIIAVARDERRELLLAQAVGARRGARGARGSAPRRSNPRRAARRPRRGRARTRPGRARGSATTRAR